MACIYNEKVERKGTPILLLLIFLGLSLIVASYFFGTMGLPSYMEAVADTVLILGYGFIGYQSYHVTKESYKYSIIADDLIIHRLSSDKNKVVEKVKIENITYFGEVQGSEKNPSKVKGSNYTCEFTKGRYCCVYNAAGQEKKFYFKPSLCMVNKIESSMRLYN